MPDWISVSERLPEESGEYIVYCSDGYCKSVSYSGRHKAFNASDSIDDASNAFDDVTHWMPLPEPPKVEKEEPNVTEGI